MNFAIEDKQRKIMTSNIELARYMNLNWIHKWNQQIFKIKHASEKSKGPSEKLALFGTQDTRRLTNQNEKKTQKTTIYVGYHYTQTNTNNENMTWALL